MPLSSIQHRVLAVIASHRDPESFVAGGTVLNRGAARYSDDIDIFHDTLERIEQAASRDASALSQAGFAVTWLRRGSGFFSATVSHGAEATKIEWVHDSDFRFFPVIADETFGYVLNPIDLAINKIAAAADRQVARDLVDLVTIHRHILPLGAGVMAAVGRAMGWTPEGMLSEIRRHAGSIAATDFTALSADRPFDGVAIVTELRTIIAQTDQYVRRMPPGSEGVLFLDGDKVVQPDPDHLERYLRHAGQRRGHWPSSPEIARAMLERFVGSGKS